MMEPISIAMFNNTPSARQPLSTAMAEPDAHALSPTLRQLGDTDYQYQDLDPEKNEIRLLYIQAGKYETPIKCRILCVCLNNPPAFTAISYMWGDSEDTCLITLDGREFPVTRSLCGALQALRSTYLGVVVWADAICINQSNNIEKSLQVRNMTKVYAAAKETCLWLGREEYDSARGLTLLDELALQTRETIKSFVTSSDRKEDFGALVDIFERGYWERLWCVQELEYSKRIIVYCGRHQAPWTTYIYVQSLFYSLGSIYIGTLGSSSKKSQPWIGVLTYGGPDAMRFEPDTNVPSRSTVIDLLYLHRSKLCMDPRDRIYAILGLVESREAARFSINYNISVRNLFIDIVKCDLEETKQLDSICVSTRGQQNHLALPSWVPDWTTAKHPIPLVHLPRGFQASGGVNSDAVFLDRRNKLQVSAIQIDKIEEVFIRMPEDSYQTHIVSILQIWRADICRSLGYDLSVHDSFSEIISLGLTFPGWDTRQWTLLLNFMIDDLLRICRPGTVLDYKLLEAMNQYVDVPIVEGNPSELLGQYIGSRHVGRQLSLTKSSLLCMSTGSIIEGDSIFVLHGCSVPVVLRHLGGNEYQFIGEIFVNGYMYGKAMEDVASGIRKVETVVLV